MSDDQRPPPLTSDIRSLIDPTADKAGAQRGAATTDGGAGSDAGGAKPAAANEENAAGEPEPSQPQEELPWAAGAETTTPDRAPLRAVARAAGAGEGEASGEVSNPDEPEADTAEHLTGLIEALLFVSPRPLGLKELARAAGLDRMRTRELVTRLQAERRHRGVTIEEVAEGYLMRSSPRFASEVQALLKLKPVRLTRSQLETLAIVAYRQPVTKPEVDEIRGVDSGQVLKGLLERGLTRMLGKKEEPGRPMLYGTTPHFLELLSLRSLKDLPTLREYSELTEENQDKFRSVLGAEIEAPGAKGSEGPQAAGEGSGASAASGDTPLGPEAEGEPEAPTPADAQSAEAEEDSAPLPTQAERVDASPAPGEPLNGERPIAGNDSRDSRRPPAPVR